METAEVVSKTETIFNEIMEHLGLTSTEKLMDLAINIILALVIFVIGKWLVVRMAKRWQRIILKSKRDETLARFSFNISRVIGMVFVVITSLGVLGVPVASLVAGVGALGLAIGFALQGALSNFAGGILIVAFRPFTKGDFVEVAGNVGTVREIDLLATKIITPDNKTIIIPNGKLMADDVINFSETENLRLDMSFGVSYSADNEHVKSVLMDVIKSDPRVLAEPAPEVVMLEHGDSCIVYGARPWCKGSDYWPLKFDITERVKVRLDQEKIEIPFPQRDVHIISHVKND